jgi:hypothetical protein
MGAITGLVVAGAKAIASTANGLANHNDVGGTLLTGALDLGVAFGTSMIGAGMGGSIAGKLGSTAINGGIQMARGGIGQNQDGSINFDYDKNLFKSGKFMSIAASTGASMLGQVAGDGIVKKMGETQLSSFLSSTVSSTIGGFGSSLQFGGDGFQLTGFNSSKFAGSMIGSMTSTLGGSGYGAGQLGAAMGNLTQLALAQNQQERAQATNNFDTGNWSAVGGILGGMMAQAIATNRRKEEIVAEVAATTGGDPKAIAEAKQALGLPLSKEEKNAPKLAQVN